MPRPKAKMSDPDQGLEVRPEVLKELRTSLAATRRSKRGMPLEDLAKELKIDMEDK